MLHYFHLHTGSKRKGLKGSTSLPTHLSSYQELNGYPSTQYTLDAFSLELQV